MSALRVNPIDVAARVLALPAGQLHAERIKGGLTNESWRVSADAHADQSVVVRISTVDEAALQLNRHSEAQVLRLVESAGIGAPVLWCSPAEHVLVTRYLSAPTPDANLIGQPAYIKALGKLFRQLHALEVPADIQASVQQVDLQQVLQGYWHSLHAVGIAVDTGIRQRAMEIASESAQLAVRCLCHTDVHHLNLLGDSNRLWLLDWEYAGLADPLFDLASLCVFHEFDAKQREQLLREYRGEVTAQEMERLERMCWLFDTIRELWMQVREISG